MAAANSVDVMVRVHAPTFYVYRTTTDKLADSLNHITESGDTVIAPTHVGGRDWVIVCCKGQVES